MRDPTTSSTNKVTTYYKQRDLPTKRKLSRGQKDLKESPVPILQLGLLSQAQFFVFVVQSKHNCPKNKRSNHNLRSKTAWLTSKILQSSRYDVKNLRGNMYKQSRR